MIGMGIGNSAGMVTAFLLAFLVCPLTAKPGAASDTRVPAELRGTWSVDSVKVNGTGIAAYLPDDPAFVGQTLRADAHALKMLDQTCEEPHLAREERPLAPLFQETFEAPPSDFRVELPDGPRPVFFVTCERGGFGPAYDRGSWIAQVPEGRIAVNWFDSVLLFLQRNN